MKDKHLLTDRQRQLFDYIQLRWRESHTLPGLDELARHMGGITPMAVVAHLEALASKGYVVRRPRHRPSYGLLAENPERHPAVRTTLLPVYGGIAAGEPLEPPREPAREYVSVQTDLLSRGAEHYVLRVNGNSMVGDGILSGDLIVVRCQRSAEQGDMVVALIEERFATLKRFYKEPSRVRLQPSNPAMEPIFSRHVEVQGIVVALVRKYD